MPVYTYTTFNDPFAITGTAGLGTNAQGINGSGQIVGQYRDNLDGNAQHGFLLSGGAFTTLDDPLATFGTAALGINGMGQVVGSYFNNTGEHGFLLSGGMYTTLDDPSTTIGTHPQGINAAGQIVGFYLDNTGGGEHGFLYSGGIFTALDDPLALLTIAKGINAAGQIVGTYFDASNQLHSFLYSGGLYTTLDDPLATRGTNAFGINDLGQIVGNYTNDSGTHAFLYSGGAYTTIDDPVNGITSPRGINNNGQIVGTLSDGTGDHGFLLTITPNPPPPAGTTADNLTLRERLFHGVRAIRLNPVDGSRMYSRAGILAHPYMLGANGQSNGCVSFSDYPEFLNAFLRGEVTRLVVVERLESPPGKFAAGQLPDRGRDELKADRSFQYAAASY